MTRGTLFYYESDDNVWSSTEFNGDMYHGTIANPQGNGDEVIKLMQNIHSIDDFRSVLNKINKYYGYDEGDYCWSIGRAAIKHSMEDTIKWIENERPVLKGDKDIDPREWKTIPSFKDVRTWKFCGTPNLSDYSYIYNNSGKDLIIKTRSKPIKMVIPDGCLGVLNYGSKDCLCKDGRIIDGMGNYEEDPEIKPFDTAIKNSLSQIKEMVSGIKADCDNMLKNIEAFKTENDIDAIELEADSIGNCAKEIYDICRNIYEAFEEVE